MQKIEFHINGTCLACSRGSHRMVFRQSQSILNVHMDHFRLHFTCFVLVDNISVFSILS